MTATLFLIAAIRFIQNDRFTLTDCSPPQSINRAAFGDGGQPRAGVTRDAAFRPAY